MAARSEGAYVRREFLLHPLLQLSEFTHAREMGHVSVGELSQNVLVHIDLGHVFFMRESITGVEPTWAMLLTPPAGVALAGGQVRRYLGKEDLPFFHVGSEVLCVFAIVRSAGSGRPRGRIG